MATILFAYEFGAGLGHLSILAAVAKQLIGRHRIVFAAPDLPLAAAYLSRSFGTDIAVNQAPKWSGLDSVIKERGTFCHTLAETLALFGFDDIDRLRAACEIWWAIVRTEKPDVVVVDSAPTARLALEARVPVVVVGTGYTVLPIGRVLPSLRPWQPHVPPQSRVIEEMTLAAVNIFRTASKGPPIDYVGNLFRGDQTFVSTLPEFDPYAAFRASEPYMPFSIPSFSPGPRFDLRSDHPIFAYLPSVHPAVMPVIEALNSIDAPCRLHLSSAHHDKVADLCRRHVRVHSVPADFSAVLPQCKAIVHHGGLGTTLAAMTAGTAQLTLPAMLENQVTGTGLEAGGSSINIQVPPAPDKERIVAGIKRLLQEASFEKGALANAQRITNFRELGAMRHVVQGIHTFLPR